MNLFIVIPQISYIHYYNKTILKDEVKIKVLACDL